LDLASGGTIWYHPTVIGGEKFVSKKCWQKMAWVAKRIAQITLSGFTLSD
jgi:hypothetical protein